MMMRVWALVTCGRGAGGPMSRRGCARTVRLGADRLPPRREMRRLITQTQGSGARLKQHAAFPTSLGWVIALLGDC